MTHKLEAELEPVDGDSNASLPTKPPLPLTLFIATH